MTGENGDPEESWWGLQALLSTGQTFEATEIPLEIGSVHESKQGMPYRVLRVVAAAEFEAWWIKAGVPDSLHPRHWPGPLYFYEILFD